jgi:ATP-dependent protease HslVU (ClpYQ) peptidase subunit
MTCIAGIVAKDGSVIIGGDSAGVAGLDMSVRKDAKVFRCDGFLYGFTTSFRMGQILRYSFKPPDHDPRVDTDTYLRTEWIDAVRKALEAGGFAKKSNGEETGGMFLLGYRGRLFQVESDYQIGEDVAPYAAVGCGYAFAKGAMFATQHSDLAEIARVRLALECAESHSAGVRGPFVVETLAAPTGRIE